MLVPSVAGLARRLVLMELVSPHHQMGGWQLALPPGQRPHSNRLYHVALKAPVHEVVMKCTLIVSVPAGSQLMLTVPQPPVPPPL